MAQKIPYLLSEYFKITNALYYFVEAVLCKRLTSLVSSASNQITARFNKTAVPRIIAPDVYFRIGSFDLAGVFGIRRENTVKRTFSSYKEANSTNGWRLGGISVYGEDLSINV